MNIGVVIQARMSSRRLPGKVLRELAGKAVLQRVVERASAAAGANHVVVATSTEVSDEPIIDWCAQTGVHHFRGSLVNVAERLCAAAEAFGFDALVRVCADSPLIDPALLDVAVERMRACDGRGEEPPEVVTNVLPRTFPPGQSVEVIRTAVLRRALEQMHDSAEREHVTLHFYRRQASFRVERIVSPMEVTDVSMTVDEPADLARLEALFADVPHEVEDAGWMELVQRLRMLKLHALAAAV